MNELHEIQNQIDQLEAQAEELRRALAERQAEVIAATAEQVRALVASHGVALAEVMAHLMPAPMPRQKAARAPMNARRWIDPQTGVGYVRGPVPTALKQRMAEMGFSGSFKAWRDQHMQVAN